MGRATRRKIGSDGGHCREHDGDGDQDGRIIGFDVVQQRGNGVAQCIRADATDHALVVRTRPRYRRWPRPQDESEGRVAGGAVRGQLRDSRCS